MTAALPLAQVEEIAVRIGRDQDLPSVERARAQRDLWRAQAWANGSAIRRAYRAIQHMRDQAPEHSAAWCAYDAALAIVAVRLVDQLPTRPQPDVASLT